MNKSQQREFLKVLQKGASPLLACMQLDVLLDSYDLTRDRDGHFRRKLERVLIAFDENVNAAVYRDAIAGNASSQAHYLRLRAQVTGAEGEQTGRENDLAEMSTEELLAYQSRLRSLGGAEEIAL